MTTELAWPSLYDDGIITEPDLNTFRKSLIEFKIKSDIITNPTAQVASTKSLIQHIQPCVNTMLHPPLDEVYRTSAVDTLSVLLTRLCQIVKVSKTSSKDGGIEGVPTDIGHDLVTLFLGHYDSASSHLSKAMRDCLSTYMTNFRFMHNESLKELTAVKAARRILTNDNGAQAGKAGFFLLEHFITKKWIRASLFFKPSDTKDSSIPFNLSIVLHRTGNRALAPSIGKFVSYLLNSLWRETQETIPERESCIEAWLSAFKDQVINAMTSGGEIVCSSMELYVLPGCFKDSKQGFLQFLKSFHISEHQESKHKILTAMVACIRVGKENGWLDEAELGSHLVSSYGLPELLTYTSWPLRLSALHLLVVAKSPSTSLHRSTLKTLREHLGSFFTNTDAEIRNRVLSTFRVLVSRLLASTYSTHTKIQRIKQGSKDGQTIDFKLQSVLTGLENELADAQSFVHWILHTLLPAQLYVGNSFQGAILALRIYSLWTKIDSDNNNISVSSSESIKIREGCKSKNVLTHIEHITFPFDLNLNNSKLKRQLLENVLDPFEDTRSLSAELLKEICRDDELPWQNLIQRAGTAMLSSGRAGEADGIARMLDVMYHIVTSHKQLPDMLWDKQIQRDLDPSLSIVKWILEVLEDRVNVEDQKTVLNGGYGVYGVMTGLKYILEERVSTKNIITPCEQEIWFDVLTRVPKIYNTIWDTVQALLCSESPEGRTVEDDDEEILDALAPANSNIASLSQMNLSFSWRVVAEASDIINTICDSVPFSNSDLDNFLTNMGSLLLTQLAQIRHRGSLSSIYPAFTSICTRCQTSSTNSVRELPSVWQERLFDTMQNTGTLITRRSAGLPMAFAAILISNLRDKGRSDTLGQTFTRLFGIAHAQANIQNDQTDVLMDLPQVHATNTLRHLFMDTNLAHCVDTFVADAFKLSITSFSSEIWAIRNCGTMLFTALLNRVFGVGSNKSRSTTGQAYSAKLFFTKYIGIQDIFEKTLQDKLDDINKGVSRSIESVFPILILISGLECTGWEDVDRFQKIVIAYLGCNVWKIREVAARSYVALLKPVDDTNLSVLLRKISRPHYFSQDSNMVHGALCAIRIVLNEIFNSIDRHQNQVVELQICRHIIQAFENMQDNNKNACRVNQGLYLRLINDSLVHKIGSENAELVSVFIKYYNASNLLDTPNPNFGDELLIIEMAKLLTLVSTRQAISLLNKSNPVAGQIVAKRLLSLMSFSMLDHKALWSIVIDQERKEYSIIVLQLLANINDSSEHYIEPTIELASSSQILPLREAAIVYLGHCLAGHSMIKNYIGYIKQWLDLTETVVSYNQPFSSRNAGLASIQRFMQGRRDVNPTTYLSVGPKLRLIFIIHTLLNDDIEEIRTKAAEVSSLIWFPFQSQPKRQKFSIPTVADQVLLSGCIPDICEFRTLGSSADVSAYSALVATQILDHLVDISSESTKTVSQAIETAISPNTLLFKLEKQNLYYDHPRIMELALSACRRIVLPCFYCCGATTSSPPLISSSSTTSPPKIETSSDITNGVKSICLVLQQYLSTSLSTLSSIFDTFVDKRSGLLDNKSPTDGQSSTADGYLGWSTSNEDIFIMGYRIATGFQIWATWVKANEERHCCRDADREVSAMEKDIISETVRKLVHKGRQKDVELNEIWLEKLEEGLKVWDDQ